MFPWLDFDKTFRIYLGLKELAVDTTFGVKGQGHRGHVTWISFPDDHLITDLNETCGIDSLYLEEDPYCFGGSGVKGQGHPGQIRVTRMMSKWRFRYFLSFWHQTQGMDSY